MLLPARTRTDLVRRRRSDRTRCAQVALFLAALFGTGAGLSSSAFAQAGANNFARPWSYLVNAGDHHEPINLIISGQSDTDFTPGTDVQDIANFLTAAGQGWHRVGPGTIWSNQCMPTTTGQLEVDSNNRAQDMQLRKDDCQGGTVSNPGGEFHSRITTWHQLGDPNEAGSLSTNAWFATVVEDHSCNTLQNAMRCVDTPVQLTSGAFTGGGYNQGKMDFARELINAAAFWGFTVAGDPAVLAWGSASGPVKCPEYNPFKGCLELQQVQVTSAGLDERSIPYDGMALEVRIQSTGLCTPLHCQAAGPANYWKEAKPSPVVDGTHTVSVFEHSMDGPITETWLTPGSRWNRASAQSSLLSDPAAIVDADDNIYVFTIGDGHKMYERHHHAQSGWNGWNIIGCCWGSSDPVAALDANGSLIVFVRGDNGHIYMNVRPRGQEFFGQNWSEVGGSAIFPGNPAVTRDQNGALHLYIVGYDQSLWEDIIWPNGATTGWNYPGGTSSFFGPRLAGVPAAVTDQDGVIRVFATKVDTGTLMEATFTSTWNYWDLGNVGDGLGWYSNPTAYVDNFGTVRVYETRFWGKTASTDRILIGSNVESDVYEAHRDRGGGWSGWVNFGPAPDPSGLNARWESEAVGIMDPSPNGGNVARLYALDSTGQLYEKHLNPGQTWSGWSNLGLGPLP